MSFSLLGKYCSEAGDDACDNLPHVFYKEIDYYCYTVLNYELMGFHFLLTINRGG